MRIYTRQGDDGSTGLYRRGRVNKSHPLISAIGAIDELNAQLGIVRALGLQEPHSQRVERIQHDLFDAGAELANTDPELVREYEADDAEANEPSEDKRVAMLKLKSEDILRLEEWIDDMEAGLPPLKEFILPGGHVIAAHVHLARTICRRAERELEGLQHLLAKPSESCSPAYLNRLSDYLFVLSRAVNRELGEDDVTWSQES